MRIHEYLRRVYSRCDCDTATSDVMSATNETTDGYNNCPYCTRTDSGYTKQELEEHFQREVERDELNIMELGRLARRIKVKVRKDFQDQKDLIP